LKKLRLAVDFLLALAWLALLFSHPHSAQLAYVGPGAGFAFLGSFLTLIAGFFLSLLSFVAWPVRMATPAPRLDLARVSTLTFEEPDLVRFPALAIARRALATGGAAPTILNAANEVAVREFVDRRLGFSGIAALVEATLAAMDRRGETAEPQSVDEALAIDHNSRRLAADLLPEIAAMAS